MVDATGRVAVLGHDRAATHRGARGGVGDGHEGIVGVLDEGGRALDLADAVDRPLALELQYAGDLDQPVAAPGRAVRDRIRRVLPDARERCWDVVRRNVRADQRGTPRRIHPTG